MTSSHLVRCAALAGLLSVPALAGGEDAVDPGSVLTFRSRVDLFTLGSNGASDCWGYVSPAGREYAVMCLTAATTFIEITDPDNPVIVATLPSNNNTTRDVKVYQDHAYTVSEGGQGIQVYDMSAIDSGTVVYVGDVTAGGTTTTHNLAVDETSGFLYRCRGGSNGLRIYDLNQSLDAPPYVGAWQDKTVHDAQVVTYTSGPLAGKQIAFCATGFAKDLTIVDVTDKSNPTALSSITWPQNQHGHQCWMDENRKYLYLNDEFDETSYGLPTTTLVFDVSDPSNPVYVNRFDNGNPAIGHNGYVKGDLLYEANYSSGLRVFDLSVNPLDPPEIDWYDTYPNGDPAIGIGLWSVYPFFPSGTVIGSDEQGGLYVWSTCNFQSYCTAGTSALGCQAQLAASGTPSASAATGFTIAALDVEGQKDGMFFFGSNGRQANPWGNGTSLQCVAPPVQRAGLLSASGTAGLCNGQFTQDLNARWTAKPNQNPGAGALVQAQFWYRDPANTGNQTTSLSDALEFNVCP